MATPPEKPRASFDAYAKDYVSLHAKSVAACGEQPEYFAKYKVACLERLFGREMAQMECLDYGCGIGLLTRHLTGRFARVAGYDPSTESLERARAEAPGAVFFDDAGKLPEKGFDLAILSGVLHHVPIPEREPLLRRLRGLLRPKRGRLVVFEHNPYNPLTRRAVAMCPFDDDAVLLSPIEAERTVRRAGFLDVGRDFIVFFPQALAFLRPVEPHLAWLPLGAQMMLTARAPSG